MATIQRQTTWTSLQTLTAGALNNEFDNVVNAWNNQDAGSTRVTILDAATLKINGQDISVWMSYRRPVLVWQTVALVDVENNTGNANETTIIFPDGSYRTVVEDTSSANKYRRFDITATASFTSGTEDSGLRSGLTEAANTWYAIYGVKSQINTAKFVLAGDTTLPLQANFATLNGRYGTNGWVYLGLIRNGNGLAANSDIVSFVQFGNMNYFTNQYTPDNVSTVGTGIQMATTAGATSLAYVPDLGTGAAQVPNNAIFNYWWTYQANDGTNEISLRDQAGNLRWSRWVGGTTTSTNIPLWSSIGQGMLIVSTTSLARTLSLGGFVDSVLGVGANPQL